MDSQIIGWCRPNHVGLRGRIRAGQNLAARREISHHSARCIQKTLPNSFPRSMSFAASGLWRKATLLRLEAWPAGIDLAMHVIERYFGRQVAETPPTTFEYQGQGWKNPNSNAIYAQAS